MKSIEDIDAAAELRVQRALALLHVDQAEALRLQAEQGVQKAQAYADETTAIEQAARRRLRELDHHGLATTCYECGVGDLDSSG